MGAPPKKYRENLGSPRFPLKGSFKGDIDIDVDVDIDMTLDALWGLSKSS